MATLRVGADQRYHTIQEAVLAAKSGDNIVVSAGTYVEQVTVDSKSNLTISADKGAIVTLKAPATLAVNGHSETYGDAVRAVLAVNDSVNVTIKGITVDGSFAGDTTSGSNGDELTGIAFLHSSGGTKDVVVQHVSNSTSGGLFGLQHGSGLFVDGGPGAPSLKVAIESTTITDFQKTGALITGVDVKFDNNTVTGVGATGLTAQNGVQAFNVTGELVGNNISGFGYTGPDYYSSGVILFEPAGKVKLSGNHIVGAPASSAAGLDLSDVGDSKVSVDNNSFEQLQYGIYAYTYDSDIGLKTAPKFGHNNFLGISVEGVHVDPEESYSSPFTTAAPFHTEGTGFSDTLSGSNGRDMLKGLGGDDTITGRGGNDLLIGGGGGDTFVYQGHAFGNDVIRDFKANGDLDVLKFKGVFNGYADVMSHARQQGDNVVITDDAHNSITLQHVQLTDLHAGDFLFV